MKASVTTVAAEAPSRLCNGPRQLLKQPVPLGRQQFSLFKARRDKFFPRAGAEKLNFADKSSKAWRANIVNVSGARLPARLHFAGLTDLVSGTTDKSG